MPSPYIINIAKGTGSGRIINGTYVVSTDVSGYNNASINPASQVISAGTDTYGFTIAATGTLTLHVTEEGTSGGVAVEGATFIRCDSAGDTYGDPIVADSDGNAVFPYVPFAASGAPKIYYKQTASVGDHEYNQALQTETMSTSEATVEVSNPLAQMRTLNLTDAHYSGLPIETGELTFTKN